jgi:hypothetical protein
VLPFFPRPYPDELLYSVIARYHGRSKNRAYHYTAEDLLGSTTARVTTLFTNNIAHLCSQLPPDSLLKPDRLIFEHTILPLYKPFIGRDRFLSALLYIQSSSLRPAENRVSGQLRDTMSSVSTFKYCPECFGLDRKEYGEVYWHRDHQYYGVFTCHKHKELLVDTGLPHTSNQRVLYRLDREFRKTMPRPNYERHELRHFRTIAKAVHWLLNNAVNDDSMAMLQQRYRRLVVERGISNPFSGLVNRQVSKALKKHYGDDFLNHLSCNIDSADANWLVGLLKSKGTAASPLRHILTLHLLGQDVKAAFSVQNDVSLLLLPSSLEGKGVREVRKEKVLSCRFCAFTTPKIRNTEGGRTQDAAHTRLLEHVERSHPNEYEEVQQALAKLKDWDDHGGVI